MVKRCEKALSLLLLLLLTDQSGDPVGFSLNTGSVLSLASDRQEEELQRITR